MTSTEPLQHERTDRAVVTTKLSPGAVADTVGRLTDIIATKPGMRLFADQRARAAVANLDLRETTLVMSATPPGPGMMAAAPLAALDLPLKVLVWADEGQTKVSHQTPSALAARHHLEPGLASGLAGIHAITDALIAA